jgi:hypothetical protein
MHCFVSRFNLLLNSGLTFTKLSFGTSETLLDSLSVLQEKNSLLKTHQLLMLFVETMYLKQTLFLSLIFYNSNGISLFIKILNAFNKLKLFFSFSYLLMTILFALIELLVLLSFKWYKLLCLCVLFLFFPRSQFVIVPWAHKWARKEFEIQLNWTVI